MLLDNMLCANLNTNSLLDTTYLWFCRVIDFVNEDVQTLAGNGTKGSDYKGGGKGTTQVLIFLSLWYQISYRFPRNAFLFMWSKNWKTITIINFQLLNSPWDVCFEPANQSVYIAMAGQHQIWEHNTLDGVTRAFSGDGYERNLNGSR